MRTSFTVQKKDNEEKSFWNNLATKLGLKKDMMKYASNTYVDRPREIVKEGLIISYKNNGEYTIKLGHKSDIIVKGIAKQEQDLQKQLKTTLSYLGEISPKVASELKKIEAAKRDILVYKDIDRCRDCVFYESDTSHETYRDKCKNCINATLGGGLNNFFPRSQQMVVFTPMWNQVGDAAIEEEKAGKKAFQGSLSLLDAHKKGSQNDRNAEVVADDIISLTVLDKSGNPISPKLYSAQSLGTALLKYFQDNKLNFQRYGKAVIEHIKQATGITMHIRKGDNVVLAIETPGEAVRLKQIKDKQEADENVQKIKSPLPSVMPEYQKKADSNINVENITVKDKGKIKFKLKDKSTEESVEPLVKKESGLNIKAEGDVQFQKYDRVHMKSDPSVKGTWMETQATKPGDIDDLVVFDDSVEGYYVVEIPPTELEAEGIEADEEQIAFADTQFNEYKKDIGAYEEEFNEKVESAMEGQEMRASASSKKKDKYCVPGAMSECKQKELEKYEDEPKDNYSKSRQLKPQGSFEGTLCVAEVK